MLNFYFWNWFYESKSQHGHTVCLFFFCWSCDLVNCYFCVPPLIRRHTSMGDIECLFTIEFNIICNVHHQLNKTKQKEANKEQIIVNTKPILPSLLHTHHSTTLPKPYAVHNWNTENLPFRIFVQRLLNLLLWIMTVADFLYR